MITNLIMAIFIIASMETSNYNHKQVGDRGEAVGLYGMHREYLEDVNRIYGTDYIYIRGMRLIQLLLL